MKTSLLLAHAVGVSILFTAMSVTGQEVGQNAKETQESVQNASAEKGETSESREPEEDSSVFGFNTKQRMPTSATMRGNTVFVTEKAIDGARFRNAEILVGDDAVEFKVTHWVTRQQFDEEGLWDSAPGLSEYVESIPPEAGGFTVDVELGLTKTLVADSLEAFAEKFPEVAAHYCKLLYGFKDQNGDSIGKRLGSKVGDRAAPLAMPPMPKLPAAMHAQMNPRALGAMLPRMKEPLEAKLEASKTFLDDLQARRAKLVEGSGDPTADVAAIDRKIEIATQLVDRHQKRLDAFLRVAAEGMDSPSVEPNEELNDAEARDD